MAAAVGSAKTPRHEEIFLERYSRLLKWAFQLTRPDRELARDLVQEAFIRFTVSAGNLVTINNVDSYLRGIVRNTYLSHLRRSSRQQHEPLPNFEFAESNSLLMVDPRRLMLVKDDLRAICQHACARKEKSISGSVLILRFFHGYVPREVAKLTQSSRNIVDVQLNAARAEALACLAKPTPVGNSRKRSRNHGSPKLRPQLTPDLLTELRQEIFATRRGQCLDANSLKNIYHSKKAVSRETLSHLVSCAQCLDAANALLGLALLRERNVIDVLGRETEAVMSGMSTFRKQGIHFLTSCALWLSLGWMLSDLGGILSDFVSDAIW
jgi:RNA polymerase sigma factor (sigma-70 family)